MQNLYSLEAKTLHIKLSNWVNEQASRGKVAFSARQAKDAFPNQSDIAFKRSLNRLSAKGSILSIYKGYYLIITPQYASRGVLPPPMYLDGLMKFLGRPYYVGILNAAGFHGAAHQQPQEFFVFTTLPVLRATQKRGIKVNYISKKEIPSGLLEDRKTESGYLKISSPELTAADLIQFEKRVGGLNRATTVLSELIEVIKPEKIDETFLKQIPITCLQRLGFILEKVLNKRVIADHLYEMCKQYQLKFLHIPLKASSTSKDFPSDEKWKVIINTQIEIDE